MPPDRGRSRGLQEQIRDLLLDRQNPAGDLMTEQSGIIPDQSGATFSDEN